MKLSFAALSLFVVLTLLSSCTQPPNYPDVPEIMNVQLNKLAIRQGNQFNPTDTLSVSFDFTDGDGDLGFEQDTIDIFLQDSRDDFETTFRIPFIPNQGTNNGISGTLTVKIVNTPFNICCTFPDGSTACQPNTTFPIDTFSYGIRIRDRAGNFSNKLQTDQITILCD